MRVLLAYSGGLDTSWLVAWLSEEGGHEVTALSVDCGGWSAEEREEIASRARRLGAVEHRFVDARAELFDRILRWLIAGNVRRGEVYPLSVGAERGLQAEILARIAAEEGFGAVAHGCTAAGNDQVRFEIALSTLLPPSSGIAALAPVRELAPSREDQVAWLEARDLPVPQGGSRYSMNAGLWGLTIGGDEMLGSSAPLPEQAWQWTRGGGGERRLSIDFAGGVPTALDGSEHDPVTLIETLNREGGALGVGRGYHLGDTVLGFKGRIAFEAPAAEVLLIAHRELEKLVLTEDQRFWKDHLGEVYGRRLHQGLFHDPLQRDVEALFASSQQRVTGTVHVALRGGAVTVEGVESPFSLMAASATRYGEQLESDDGRDNGLGLARALAEPGRLHRRAELTPTPPPAPLKGSQTTTAGVTP